MQEQTKLLKTMNLQEYAVLQNALALENNQVPRVEFLHPELLERVQIGKKRFTKLQF